MTANFFLGVVLLLIVEVALGLGLDVKEEERVEMRAMGRGERKVGESSETEGGRRLLFLIEY